MYMYKLPVASICSMNQSQTVHPNADNKPSNAIGTLHAGPPLPRNIKCYGTPAIDTSPETGARVACSLEQWHSQQPPWGGGGAQMGRAKPWHCNMQ